MWRKIVRVAATVLLFTVAPIIEELRCSSLSSLANSDIWWHLSSGLWILQHHAFPRTGLFSQTPDAAWIAASWLYDLRLAVWYKLFGLAAIPLFLIAFKVALAVVTFLLAGGRRGNFWPAVGISAIAQYILGSVQPVAAYSSIILFGIEFLILLWSRQSGRVRVLYWLVPLFLAWANLDMNFVYGVALIALFLIAEFSPFAASRRENFQRSELIRTYAAIFVLCLLATLITPYFYHPYGAFFATAFSSANRYLPDFHAPGFRQPQDYVLALLTMSAFFALGLRRSRDPFLILALVGCSALSFYSQRDIWLVTLAAVAVIGGSASAETEQDSQSDRTLSNRTLPNRSLGMAVALAVAILLTVGFLRMPRSRTTLLAKVAEGYPVAASNYVRDHHLPQPLFNAFEWGGFLTWYLPEYPVAIDGRTRLYGDEFVVAYSNVMNADVRYTEFPAMANARTIILPSTTIMAQALKSLPAYHVAYSDNVALVLTKAGNDATVAKDGELTVPGREAAKD